MKTNACFLSEAEPRKVIKHVWTGLKMVLYNKLSVRFFCAAAVVRQGFVVQLVCDLLDEGNAAFREGDWTEAQDHFSEGINVALYAQAEGLNVPGSLLESLYINRAAVHQNMVNLTPYLHAFVGQAGR